MSKTVLFLAIRFSISTQFSSILPIDRTLSGATTLSQSGPGSNSNEGVLRIPKISSITKTSPSDCSVSYQDTRCRGGGLSSLQRSSRCILQPQPTGEIWFVLKSVMGKMFLKNWDTCQLRLKMTCHEKVVVITCFYQIS